MEKNEWNLDDESLKVLSKLSKNKKCALEIGTAEGFSTGILAENCSKVITIEKDHIRLEKAKKRLKKYCNVIFLEGDALEILKTLNEKFDFVFIDAMKREYLSYFNLIRGKLTKDAVIVADNVISHSSKMQDYLEYVRKHFKSETINVGKGLEVTQIIEPQSL